MSATANGAIAHLAAWASGVRSEAFSPRAVEQAKLVLLDTIGCGLAALDDDSARAVLATLASFGDKPQCTVLGRRDKMSAPNAVLANGTLVRVLDLNDYVVGAHPLSGARGGHPSDNIPWRSPPPSSPDRAAASSWPPSSSATKSTGAARR